MPHVFLIKKRFRSGASVSKPKRARDEGPAPISPQKCQDDSNDYHPNPYIPQDLTPPRTPSTDSIKTPPPGVTVIASRSDLRNNEHLSPTISEPLNLNTSASTWPKAMVPPYLPFNFSSLYPSFPQPIPSPDFYPQLYQVPLPQRAALPAEQSQYPRDRSPLKKPEPLTPLPVDANNSNDNVSYLYRMWYSRENNKKESLSSSAPGTPNSDVSSGETVDVKKSRGAREAPRYQCTDCNKSYSTMSGLSKHQQFHCVTQTKKSFGCKYCDKVYVSLGALKMHIRTHTLPCKCKLCGKAFSRPWLLQGHVRTHTGEKPFACQHCNRAFADRSNLRAHLQTHSDVKKYSCKNCSKTFSRMSLLLKHEDGGCSGSKDVDATMMTQVPR